MNYQLLLNCNKVHRALPGLHWTGELNDLMDTFKIRDIRADAKKSYKQWRYGTFIFGPEMMIDALSAQEHTYTIDQVNRQEGKSYISRCGAYSWEKFHAQPTPTVVVAQHLYSKSGRQNMWYGPYGQPSPPQSRSYF
jgi:hypothetical protein